MSASDRSTPPAQPTERLEVPTLPPPSSRFVLPPPPSALLSRLQAFLPQIRDANAALEPREGELAPQDEAVVMEEITDSSDSDDSSDDSSSSDSDGDSDDDDEGGARATGGPVGATAEQDNAASGAQEERGTLAHLMDISARPAVVKKKLLVQEEAAVGEAGADGDEMQAD
ncbi:hypothetical protein JCM10450v2_003098 [Rhodotorula kratochvilovae]